MLDPEACIRTIEELLQELGIEVTEAYTSTLPTMFQYAFATDLVILIDTTKPAPYKIIYYDQHRNYHNQLVNTLPAVHTYLLQQPTRLQFKTSLVVANMLQQPCS